MRWDLEEGSFEERSKCWRREAVVVAAVAAAAAERLRASSSSSVIEFHFDFTGFSSQHLSLSLSNFRVFAR